MFLKYDYKFVYVVIFIQFCYCRGNENGIASVMGKKYMVYFVQSTFTKNFQESWICGGALVTTTQILTAAACLVETENIYAIAGYNKYLNAKDIENDQCTRTRKQRVIKILLTTEKNEHPAQRTNVNIGIAVVEKPYNFSDPAYLTYCSYKPQLILVNFENKYELVNTQAFALGWGTIDDKSEFTQETAYRFLQETPTVLVDKKNCTNIFDTPEIVQLIDEYHLCGSNYFKEIENDTEYRFRSLNDSKMENYEFDSENNTGENNDDLEFRRQNNEENKSNSKSAEQIEENYSDVEKYTTKISVYGQRNARKDFNQKICQNNLGSPLIKWIDDREVMIGITSSAKNSENNGPVLYVSTAASSKLIKCLLETNAAMRQLCNLKSNDGQFEIREIDIKWPELEELDTLTSQSAIDYINRANDEMHAIDDIQQQQSTHVHEQILQKSHIEAYASVHPVPYQGYAHMRVNVPPLIARPQFDLGSKDLKKTHTEGKQSYEYELSPEKHNKKQPLYKQYDSQLRQHFDTTQKQKYERPFEIRKNLTLGDQYRLSNNQHLNRQNRSQFNHRFSLSPHQPGSYNSPKGIKDEYELFPDTLSDQSREQHRTAEPSKSYMAQIEALHHKLLAKGVKEGEKEASSFEQILARLQEPPSPSLPRRYTNAYALQMLIDQIIQHNTKHHESYEENQEVSHLGQPVSSGEVLIRPQIPMSKKNY